MEFFAIASPGILLIFSLFALWPRVWRDSLALTLTEMGFALAIGWVVFCVTLRRLHDANQGGYWFYIPFGLGSLLEYLSKHHQISIGSENLAGAILVTVFLLVVGLMKGVRGDNMFGPDPSGLV